MILLLIIIMFPLSDFAMRQTLSTKAYKKNRLIIPESQSLNFSDEQLKHIFEPLRSKNERFSFKMQINPPTYPCCWISSRKSEKCVQEALSRTSEQLHEIYERKINKEYLKIITRLNFFAHLNDSDISEKNYYAAVNNNCIDQLVREINSRDS